MPDPQAAKRQMRTILRGRLAAFDPLEAAAASERLCRRLSDDAVVRSARTLLAFIPLADQREIDLRSLMLHAMKGGKAICLPRVDWTTQTMTARRVTDLTADLEPELSHPALGLLHPRDTCPVVAAADLDLLLVPGLGFDDCGGRIGRGAGFYDRFLDRPEVRGLIVGVAFEEQVLPPGDLLPREPHDRTLDALVTPDRTLHFTRRAAESDSQPPGPADVAPPPPT